MPTRTRKPRARSGRSELDDALDGLRDLGDVVSSLGRSSSVSAGAVRALAEDGVRALGVRSTSTQKILADLIATLGSAASGRLPGVPGFGGGRGGGGGGFLGDVADTVGDVFGFSAPLAGGREERLPSAPAVTLNFSSVVSNRRELDRHVREEIEPRLRTLWASRTRAQA